jgi:hypothetical protein
VRFVGFASLGHLAHELSRLIVTNRQIRQLQARPTGLPLS